MPSTGDIRLSFPIGLFCMATLSWTLLSALDQSVAPSTVHPIASDPPDANQKGESKTTLVPVLDNHEIRHAPAPVTSAKEQVPPKDHAALYDVGPNHFSDGLDDDIYWNDGSA